MRKPKPNAHAGFSLLEVLIAAMVVGVGLLGLARLQSGFFANSGESRTRTAALHFAQQKLELFRGFLTKSQYDAQFVSTEGSDSCDPAEENSGCAGINAVLDRSWQIASCPNSVACKEISVVVSWTGPDGVEQTVRLMSYLAPADIIESGLALAD